VHHIFQEQNSPFPRFQSRRAFYIRVIGYQQLRADDRPVAATEFFYRENLRLQTLRVQQFTVKRFLPVRHVTAGSAQIVADRPSLAKQ